ncbi:MAG: NAD(P)/FAD-dependent oxidoreductase [Gammaproteobacteria bacterium]|nr:NAD(P)/FAD-dependent oxidoreductase [Gammaproteobacteria bacterium]
MTDRDAIVIGAGHNGLACAGYLARSGLSVKVLERRPVVGGAAVTEEFHPGFRNSVYAYAVSLLHPDVVRDLELHRHGLEIIERPAGTISLLEGDHLLLSRDPHQARREIARFSPADAACFDEYDEHISAVALTLRELAVHTPPDLSGGWRNALRLLRTGNTLRKLGRRQRTDLAELMTKSLGDYLDSWFESDALKGILGLECVIGNFVDPYQAGTAYVLLHHAFGEVNGRTGAWGHAKGGMGAITQAMAAFAREQGAEIETDAPVRQIRVKNGQAHGVITEDGRLHEARVIAANLHPQLLLTRLLDPGLLEPATRRRIRAYRSHSATFRMNVALGELPRFAGVPEQSDEIFKGAIEICPSLGYMRRAYASAQTAGWSDHPIISMWLPSTQDESLAPAGGHVASLFCQHFQRHLPDGRSWDDEKEGAADHIIDTVNRHAPNFRASILGRQIKTPLDIERDLGMVGGDIFHGALHLDQLFSLRPLAGHADYRMPVKSLFLCGSGAHPGGGVTGLPGRNAAHEILRTLRT